MHVETVGGYAVDLAQESKILGVTVARVALTHHGALEHVKRGEQGGGAVAFVVVGEGAGAPLLHGQSRLGAVKGLDL